MNRAIFLDKDGTLIENVPYNVDPARISLAAGALEGLRELKEAGYRLIVVSNQSGVAHGYFPEKALRAVEERLRELLRKAGIELDGFYFCPHHPKGKVAGYAVPCECRKPKPGLIRRAAAEHDIDLQASWVVGDILNDVAAGGAAGCRTILILNGNETEWNLAPGRWPEHLSSNLMEAAELILREDRTGLARTVTRHQRTP